MAITPKDVEYVALLARIGLSAEQKAVFTQELGKIVEFVSQLNEVNTEHVPETAQVGGLRNVTREDKPRPGLDRSELLKLAPAYEDEQLKVRGIFS